MRGIRPRGDAGCRPSVPAGPLPSGRRPAVSPADAQRIACSATLSAMLHDPSDGSVLDCGGGGPTPRPPPSAARYESGTVPAAASPAATPAGPTGGGACGHDGFTTYWAFFILVVMGSSRSDRVAVRLL
jgi:hypothetical protein